MNYSIKKGKINFKNTGVMCMLSVPDSSSESGFKHIDIGNYFISPDGTKCVITSIENARKYQHKIGAPIYVEKSHGIKGK